jgi:hypothetical protein
MYIYFLLPYCSAAGWLPTLSYPYCNPIPIQTLSITSRARPSLPTSTHSTHLYSFLSLITRLRRKPFSFQFSWASLLLWRLFFHFCCCCCIKIPIVSRGSVMISFYHDSRHRIAKIVTISAKCLQLWDWQIGDTFWHV